LTPALLLRRKRPVTVSPPQPALGAGVRVPGFPGRHAGKVCAAHDPGERLDHGYEHELNYLKVYAYRIRRKLGDDHGHVLHSDPSVGYRLAVDGGP
jgi:DNA-binding response OmpR family regulator